MRACVIACRSGCEISAFISMRSRRIVKPAVMSRPGEMKREVASSYIAQRVFRIVSDLVLASPPACPDKAVMAVFEEDMLLMVK